MEIIKTPEALNTAISNAQHSRFWWSVIGFGGAPVTALSAVAAINPEFVHKAIDLTVETLGDIAPYGLVVGPIAAVSGLVGAIHFGRRETALEAVRTNLILSGAVPVEGFEKGQA